MSRVPGWLGKVGAGLSEMGERLDERRTEVAKEHAEAAPEPPADDLRPPQPVPVPVVIARDRPEPALAVPWGCGSPRRPAGGC